VQGKLPNGDLKSIGSATVTIKSGERKPVNITMGDPGTTPPGGIVPVTGVTLAPTLNLVEGGSTATFSTQIEPAKTPRTQEGKLEQQQ
jgi:uncharacterized protein YjdB